MLRIRFPQQVNVESCSDTIQEFNLIAESESSDIVSIDLSNVQFIKPFGVTLTSSIIYSLLTDMRELSLIPSRSNAVNGYLRDMGFFDEFQIAENIRVKPRSTSVGIKRLHRDADNSTIINYVDNLIKWLSKELEFSIGIKNGIRLSILEIINNVVDHSLSPFGCYICAQTYPNKREMELSITDFGVGVPYTLKPFYPEIQDDADAIEYATRDGVSCRRDKGAVGTGLNFLKEFIKMNNGEMYILSESGRFELRDSKEDVKLLNIAFPGTCVCLNIKIGGNSYFLSDGTDFDDPF